MRQLEAVTHLACPQFHCTVSHPLPTVGIFVLSKMTWFQFDQVLQQAYHLRSLDHGGAPDCFFLCVKALCNLNVTIQQLRNTLADYVLNHPPDQEAVSNLFSVILEVQPDLLQEPQMIPDETPIQRYVRWLRSNLFASDVEINALCCCFNLRVRIFSQNLKTGEIVQQTHGGTNEEKQLIILCFHNNHYRATSPYIHTRLRVSSIYY